MITLNQSPLAFWAETQPHAVALRSPNQSLSYQELAHQVAALCEQLRQQGLRSGQHLGVITHNDWHGVQLLLACQALGLVCCALSPYFKTAELERLSQELSLSGYWSDTATLKTNTPKLLCDFNASSSDLSILPTINPQAPLDMVLTSASSGRPKAVVHHWQNHYYSAQGSQQTIPLNPNDGWLLSLPLFHIGGQAIVWRSLLAGSQILIEANNTSLLESLESLPVTHLSLVPTQLYRLLLQEEFHSETLQLRHILVGGGPCNEQRLKQAEQRGFKAYMSYGSSEMSSQIATRKVGSGIGAGRLLAGTGIKFEDDEICLRGPTLCLGYWQAGQCRSPSDAQGWYHTQDLGALVGDDLLIAGRRDNLFVCGGENIQPETIEALLLTHPQILAAIVVGRDSEEYGQQPVAFIESQPRLAQQEVIDYLREFLPGLQLPKACYRLPESSRLKVSRHELTLLANQKQADAPQPL